MHGAYGALPKDIWSVILSKMNHKSLSLMISVHPKLFGSLISGSTPPAPILIDSHLLREDTKPDVVRYIDDEPEKYGKKLL